MKPNCEIDKTKFVNIINKIINTIDERSDIDDMLSEIMEIFDTLLFQRIFMAEQIKEMKLFILNENFINYTIRSFVLKKQDFAMLYKDELVDLGITREEQEEYIKQRLEEAKQEDK